MPPGPSGITIRAVGDIMTGDSPLRLGFGAGSALDHAGIDAMADRLRSILGAADLVIGNLEVPIGEAPWTARDYVDHQFLGHPETARLLARAGMRAVSVANNHILQHGRAAFDRTVSALEAEGITVVGRAEGPRVEPAFLAIGGLRVALFGLSLRPEVHSSGPIPYCGTAAMGSLIERLRGGASEWDLCLVASHWGAEYMRDPAPSQVRLARELLDAGADIVLGHHPHVLQRVEIRRGRLVAYSLGNFVFDMWRPWPRESGVLEIRWARGRGVESATVLAAEIGPDGWPDRAPGNREGIVVEPARDETSGSASAEADPEARYWAEAARAESRNALDNRRFFVRNLRRYRPGVALAAVTRFVSRRGGGG